MKNKKGDYIYDFVKGFPDQIENSYAIEVPRHWKEFERVVIIGMGGSYIAGLVLKEFIKDEIKMPIEVYSGEIPYVDDKTLIVLISYSGNTKEIVSAFWKLRKRNLVVISSGGKLVKFAKKNKKILIKTPLGLHQRFTFAYGFFPLLKFFEKTKYISSKEKIVDRIILSLKMNQNELENQAIKLATRLHIKIPLFYGTDYFYPACYRLQTAIEEDTKIICHSNKIPELFHNELESFPNSYLPILILDNKESLTYKKQMKYFKNLARDYFEFQFEKHMKEERMFLAIYFADFLGFYLSKIRGTPMGETPLSDEIKKL